MALIVAKGKIPDQPATDYVTPVQQFYKKRMDQLIEYFKDFKSITINYLNETIKNEWINMSSKEMKYFELTAQMINVQKDSQIKIGMLEKRLEVAQNEVKAKKGEVFTKEESAENTDTRTV